GREGPSLSIASAPRGVRMTVAGLSLIAGLGLAPARGQDAKADMGGAYWKTAASGYRISGETEPERPWKLREEPILRWSNPVRKTGDGAVFVWTDRGRPEVVASFYRYGPEEDLSEDHEFMSLATTPLRAERDGLQPWTPTVGGVVSKPIPNAAAPAANAAGRLRQMRALAREFKANFNNPPDQSEIRLLTQPIYRFEIPEPRPDLLDGALFAFVHTTDPEVLLLIEAVRTDGGSVRWYYALARMSMVSLRVQHKDREVWSAEWDTDIKNPAKPYMSRTVLGRGR
ncbi:MAG: hypothetical protein WKF75_05840, partial [Singulisphaera sp.]